MKTTEELVRIALLPKPITVEISGIAEKCFALTNSDKAFSGKGTVCIYNHFANTFDELPADAIIQSKYPVLVFKVKGAKTHAFFTPSNMPYTVEGEVEPDFWKFTFDQRYGEPVEPTHTVVGHNSFSYMDFKRDALYTDTMSNYMVDNAYTQHLMAYTDFGGKYFISKNLHEFKVYNPHVLRNNAHRLGYVVDPYNKFIRGCNLTRLKTLVSCAVAEESFGISTVNLGNIENKINRVEDDIALLNTEQPFDRIQRLLTLGDLVKIQVSYIMHLPAHRIKLLNYNGDLDSLTLQWLSYVYIYESFMLGCKPVRNLKASTLYAMIQLNHFYYPNKQDQTMPDLAEYTVTVGADGKAPRYGKAKSQMAYSYAGCGFSNEEETEVPENLDIKLLDFLKCLDECIALKQPDQQYIDEAYCEEIYQSAFDKVRSVNDLIDLFFV